jgi:hypothetical protein
MLASRRPVLKKWGAETPSRRRPLRPVNAEILATTYFPERLPSQYLRRWRA